MWKRMKFKNFETLRTNKDYKLVYENKKSSANKLLVMYMLCNGTDKSRIGISVSKKVGNSIVRHRLCRLIRESIRLNAERIANGYDIVFVARSSLKDKNYFETESAIMHLLKVNNLLVNNNEMDNDQTN